MVHAAPYLFPGYGKRSAPQTGISLHNIVLWCTLWGATCQLLPPSFDLCPLAESLHGAEDLRMLWMSVPKWSAVHRRAQAAALLDACRSLLLMMPLWPEPTWTHNKTHSIWSCSSQVLR